MPAASSSLAGGEAAGRTSPGRVCKNPACPGSTSAAESGPVLRPKLIRTQRLRRRVGKTSPNPFRWGQLVFSSKVELGYKRSCHGRHACRYTFGHRAG